MFETTEVILQRIGIFMAIGFFLGAGYDVLRFFRILFKKGRIAVNIEDLLYLPFCAFILFCCIVEYGGGDLRLYFFLAALLGAAIYLATLGNVTRYAAKGVRALFLLILNAIKKPLYNFYTLFQQILHRIFGTFCQKISNTAKKLRFHLKKKADLLYNKSNSKMEELRGKDGEQRHVVKAKVRKKA